MARHAAAPRRTARRAPNPACQLTAAGADCATTLAVVAHVEQCLSAAVMGVCASVRHACAHARQK